jgi:hypothetical protein
MDRHRLTYAPEANMRNDASGDSTSTTGATVPNRASERRVRRVSDRRHRDIVAAASAGP